MRLTRQQKDVIERLVEYYRRYGFFPSRRRERPFFTLIEESFRSADDAINEARRRMIVEEDWALPCLQSGSDHLMRKCNHGDHCCNADRCPVVVRRDPLWTVRIDPGESFRNMLKGVR